MGILIGTVIIWVVLAATIAYLYYKLRNVPSLQPYLWTKISGAFLIALAFALRLYPQYVSIANWIVGIGLAIWFLGTLLFRPRRNQPPTR
jgi:hypothetical protein